MTTVIDERVVEMRFNNADFEKNVAQSMATLEKLKDSLNFDSAKSLESIGKASKKFSMENVGNQVETIQAKFSAMQVVGMTALSEITKKALSLGSALVHKVIDPIASGGMRRALNIENAKFQLEGLDVAWNRISDDINYGVKDTAYGLDAAAKAASQLVTSGVQFGKEWGETGNSPMAKALRGISGVAAMTNSSYEEISEIFTSIAGKGKAMTMEFNRLGQRGLNGAAAVATFFNKVNDGTIETSESVQRKIAEMTGGLHVTEQDIKDFASKSKIDFELFSYAMDDAFGEHAKEANKTFTGALSNVKAALSRIGANFATPYLESARKVFVDLIGVLNHFNKALDPVYKRASVFMQLIQTNLSDFLTSDALKSGITTLIDALVRGFDGLVKVLSAVKIAFDSVFPSSGGPAKRFANIADAISKFIDKVLSLTTTKEVLISIFTFFQGIFSVGKLVIDIFKQVFAAISPVATPLEFIFRILTRTLTIIGLLLTAVSNFIRENLSLANILNVLGDALSVVSRVLIGIGTALAGGIIFAINNFGRALNYVLTALKSFSGFITSIFNNGLNVAVGKFDKLTSIFNGFSSGVEKTTTVVKKMDKNFGAAGDSVAKFGTLTKDATDEVAAQTRQLRWYELVVHKVRTAISTVVTVVGGSIAVLASAISTFFSTFRARYAEATIGAKSLFDYIKAFFTTLGSFFSDFGKKISDFFTKLGIGDMPFVEKLKMMAKAVADFIKELGPGRITALAFAAAMTGLVAAAVKVAVSFSTLITSVRRVFTTVESILKSKFFSVKQQPIIIQLAEAFAILAVSLGLLTKLVDPDELKKTADVMLDLMVTFTLCAGALRLLDFVISKMGLFSNFKLVNSTILSLALSMGILVAAFIALNKIEIAEDWSKKLLIMAIMFGEVAVAAGIISKFAPKLAGGSLLILTLALSMKTMVDAFATITSDKLESIRKNLIGFTAIFAAVAALTAAAGRLRLTSALALLIIAKSFSVILPMFSQVMAKLGPAFTGLDSIIQSVSGVIDKLQSDFMIFMGKLKGFFVWVREAFGEIPAAVITCVSTISLAITSVAAIGGIIGIGVVIARIITAIGSLSRLLVGFGVAVIGVAVAIKIVTESFIQIGDYLKELTNTEYVNVLAGFATLAAILTAMVGLVTLIDAVASLITRNAFYSGKTVRTSFIGIGMAFAGIALAMNVIAKSLNSMEKISPERYWDLIKGVSLILVCLGVAAAGAGMITKGGSAVLGLIGVVTSFALLLAGVAVLSAMWTPENDLAMTSAFIGLGVIAASISAVILSFSRLKNPGAILSLMIPALAMLVTIVGSLYLIGNMKDFNIGAVITVIAGIGVTIFMVVKLLEALSSRSGLGNVKKVPVLLTAIGLLAVIAAALAGLALTVSSTGGGAMLGAFILLNLELAAVIGMMTWISNMKAVGTGLQSKLNLLGACIAAIAVVVGALVILGAAVKDLGWNILGGFVILNLQLVAIVGMMTYIAKMGSVGTGLKSKMTLLIACMSSLVIVALTIGIFANAIKKIGSGFIVGAMVALNLQLALIVGMMYVITKLNVKDNFVRRIVLLGSCIAAMVAVTIALGYLSNTIRKNGITNFNAGFKALAVILGELGGILFAVGALSGLMDKWSKTVGAIGLLLGGIGMLAMIGYELSKLSEIDAAKLDKARGALQAIAITMGVITGVLGIIQGLIVGVASFFGSAAGGWAGALALPLLITAVGGAVALMGTGLVLGAKAVEILAKALAMLVPVLSSIAELPMADIVKNLIGLGDALLQAGGGLLVFDLAAAGGFIAIGLLVLVLAALNTELPTFNKEISALAAIDLSSIAAGLIELGVAGLVLGSGAAGVAAYALALSGLNAAIGTYSGGGGAPAIISETEEQMETHVVKAQTYGAEFTTNYASGTLTKEGEVVSATEKVVGAQTTILEEEVPKAAEVAMDDYRNITINGVEMTYKDATAIAQSYGYETAEEYQKAIDDGLIMQSKSTTRIALEGIAEEGKKVIVDGAKETVDKVNDQIKDFNLDDVLSKLSGKFGDIGSVAGALFGQNAAITASQALAKLLGSFDFMFKQSGFLNKAGKEISQYGANGMTTEAMNAMYKGVSSTAAKGLEGTMFDSWLTNIKDTMSDIIPKAADTGTALEGVGESSGKGSKGVKDLADSLRSGLDLFSKFEVKTEMTSKQLLENMKSNIDGYASWSHRMTVLAERFVKNDIPVTLLEKLKDDGPKQQEVMNAIYNMTDEELTQLRELYATGMALPESQAEIVGSAFTYMGEMATQGFSDALNDHKAAHEAAHGLGQSAIDGVAEAIDAHSPSRKTFALGVYMIDGLGLGMTSPSALSMLELCVSQVTSKVLELFDEGLSPETMSLVGENMLQNLFSNALGNMITSDNPIISAFAKGLMQIGPVLEALTSFVETVLTEINTAFGMEDSSSTSEVFYGYGKGSVEGFSKGISNNLGYIHTQLIIMGMKVAGWLTDEKYADKFYDAGKNAILGFAEGLSDSDAAEKVMSNAQDIAKQAAEKMASALDEESPSKLTRKIGEYASLGLAIGISDGARNVEVAASSVAEGAIDSMSDTNGRIQDLLNSELDLNPIITPMLDLSIMRAQLAGLNEMMGNPAYGVNGQNGGRFTTDPEVAPQINFTQNNYSPKELSRIDIYRQTKNQISMIKGVKGVVANA